MDLAKLVEGQRSQLARLLLRRDDLAEELKRTDEAIAEQRVLIAQTTRLAIGQRQAAEEAASLAAEPQPESQS